MHHEKSGEEQGFSAGPCGLNQPSSLIPHFSTVHPTLYTPSPDTLILENALQSIW